MDLRRAAAATALLAAVLAAAPATASPTVQTIELTDAKNDANGVNDQVVRSGVSQGVPGPAQVSQRRLDIRSVTLIHDELYARMTIDITTTKPATEPGSTLRVTGNVKQGPACSTFALVYYVPISGDEPFAMMRTCDSLMGLIWMRSGNTVTFILDDSAFQRVGLRGKRAKAIGASSTLIAERYEVDPGAPVVDQVTSTESIVLG